jgi:S-adenosylmethionine hydrolase
VDHFGNAQLAARVDAMPDSAVITLMAEGVDPDVELPVPVLVRRVRTFGDLMAGEVGVLGDANGHLAVVVREGSAARRLGLEPGCLITLAW